MWDVLLFFIASPGFECGFCIGNHIFYLKCVCVAPLAVRIDRVTPHVIKPVEKNTCKSKDFIKSNRKYHHASPIEGDYDSLDISRNARQSALLTGSVGDAEFISGSEESPL